MSTRFALGLAGCQAGLEALPLEEAIAAVARAGQAGLDGVWVNEEHLGGRVPGRVCWATLPFLAYVAGRVPGIRLGTAALLLGLHHPLRLAEEIASLCAFAPGRVRIGIAPSRPGPYADAFGLPADIDHRCEFDLVRTALDALLAGSTVELTEGRHRGSAVSSLVVPATPPVWHRAAYSPESISTAARERMPLVQHYIQSPESILRGREHYRRAAGPNADALLRDSPVHRFVALGHTDAEARQRALGLAEILTARLRGFGIDQRATITSTADLEPSRFAAHTAIAGSPATVAAKLRALAAETGTGTVNINLGWMGAATPEQVREATELFITELLPGITSPHPGDTHVH